MCSTGCQLPPSDNALTRARRRKEIDACARPMYKWHRAPLKAVCVYALALIVLLYPPAPCQRLNGVRFVGVAIIVSISLRQTPFGTWCTQLKSIRTDCEICTVISFVTVPERHCENRDFLLSHSN